jgi:hypothetical protein
MTEHQLARTPRTSIENVNMDTAGAHPLARITHRLLAELLFYRSRSISDHITGVLCRDRFNQCYPTLIFCDGVVHCPLGHDVEIPLI